MKNRITLALLASIGAVNLNATEPGLTRMLYGTASIEGTITNDRGDTVSFATVWLERNGNAVIDGSTNGHGYYNLSGLEPGDYQLGIREMNHKDTLIDVFLVSDKITFRDVTIVRSGTLLGPIEIPYVTPAVNTGDPNPTKTWTPETMEHFPLQNVPAIVSTQEGMYTPDDGDEVFALGTRGDGAMMSDVDGMRSRGVIDIPIEAIQELRVYTTGIPARYGDFLGGVVQIRTKSL